ncbi:ThiF family adenylyltransferase [Verrucomicrobiota bacterium]
MQTGRPIRLNEPGGFISDTAHKFQRKYPTKTVYICRHISYLKSMPNRFHRMELVTGKEGLQKLTDAHVTVVGLGGVGAACVEALARGGVGHLRLIDAGDYELSNLNRQLFATEGTLGQPKAEAAKARVLAINPHCEVTAEKIMVSGETNEHVLSPAPDVLIDAIDMLSPKVGMLEYAYNHKIPCIISSMGAANRTDPTKVSITDLSKTKHCRLARFIRKRLRKRGIHNGIRCVYSEEISGRNTHQEMPDFEAPSKTLDGQERPPLGSMSYMPPIFGFTAAAEAIQFILEKK